MTEKTVTIKNPLGLHMRPAQMLCEKAMEFESRIMICFRDREFNAKSMLSVLSACVHQEDEIRIVCDGSDEEQAVEAMISLLESGL